MDNLEALFRPLRSTGRFLSRTTQSFERRQKGEFPIWTARMGNRVNNGKCMCDRLCSVLPVGPRGRNWCSWRPLIWLACLPPYGGPREFSTSITLSCLGSRETRFALKISHANPLNRRQFGRTEKIFEDRAQIFQDVFLQPDNFFFERRNSRTGQFRGQLHLSGTLAICGLRLSP